MRNNKEKIKFKMIDSNGLIYFEKSPRYSKSDFSKQLKHIEKYFFIEPHDWKNGKIISFNRNNKMQNALILRTTSSGDKNRLGKKRIQIKKTDIKKKKPDFVIAIYEFKNNVLYASINDFSNFKFSSNNITTLTWINFFQLENATKNGFNILNKKNYKIFVYKDLKKLLKVLDNDKNHIPNKWIWLKEFKFDENKNFKNTIKTVKNYKQFLKDFEIGEIGEKYFYNLCKEKNPIIKKISPNFNFKYLKWLNKKKESYFAWDFKYKNIFIEIKSSKSENFFFLSKNEKNIMDKSSDSNYILIKLNNYNSKTKKFDKPIFYDKNALLKMNNEAQQYLFTEKRKN